MKAEATAFMYERLQLNVTRPEPIGYLCLSVSMPELFNHQIHKLIRCYNCFFNVNETHLHKPHHRKGHSWFLLGRQQSVCHGAHQQTPFYWDPIFVMLESHNSNQQWSTEWLPPEQQIHFNTFSTVLYAMHYSKWRTSLALIRFEEILK